MSETPEVPAELASIDVAASLRRGEAPVARRDVVFGVEGPDRLVRRRTSPSATSAWTSTAT